MHVTKSTAWCNRAVRNRQRPLASGDQDRDKDRQSGDYSEVVNFIQLLNSMSATHFESHFNTVAADDGSHTTGINDILVVLGSMMGVSDQHMNERFVLRKPLLQAAAPHHEQGENMEEKSGDFPKQWLFMVMLQNLAVMKALRHVAAAIRVHLTSGQDFQFDAWNNFFVCAIMFIRQPSLR